MDWRIKAGIQRAVAALPPAIGSRVYYFMQRRFGGLRESDPTLRFRGAIEMMDGILALDGTIEGRTFLEVGTGWRLYVPIAFWLCGASGVTTVDLYAYLRRDLVVRDIKYIAEHTASVRKLFGGYADSPCFEERLASLLATDIRDLDELLAAANIRYVAPADAGRLTGIATESFDYHVSFTTVEHIPPHELRRVFDEGRRILRPGGLFVFVIDMSDHFSHSDTSISTINFLRYTEREWERLAGNRFSYHNRLRIDELEMLLTETGIEIVTCERRVDRSAVNRLEAGFPLSDRFRGKQPEINATFTALVIGRGRR